MQTISLNVSGMTCGGCEERIARALRRIPGISAIEADHRSGAVRVIFDPARVSDDAIRAAIERAGYEVAA
jgi:copper chaperone